MIELNEEQRGELASAEPLVINGLLDEDASLMYPMLANLDPEDWEDVAIYEDKL